jgi:hypothetical protein
MTGAEPLTAAFQETAAQLPPIRFTSKGKTMKYLVPPIVIPVLLFIGVVAYGMLRPPIIVGHPPAPAANSQAR